MPPGAVSQPYGTRADILCAGQRDRPHNSTNDRMVANWEASFRHPLDQALAALGGESLAAALGSYAMEWHIEDGDAWSIFARGTDRDPWWQGEGMAHLGMRELIDAAMTAFAPGVRDALVPQHRRR